MMDDSHDVKTAASSNNEESDSDRKTPSSNSDDGSVRADTPGPMPKYMYTKKDLVEIAESPASKRRPDFLKTDFDTTDGYWDPERWTRSFDSRGDGSSRGNSPIILANARDRKRPVDSERDPYKRRAPADPKARLKEEDEDLGIVLSPQRRSFGTGCHVTTINKLRPGSPTDADPRDRRDRGGERRIGSGRIQIDRERDVRDRDSRDRDQRDRDPRERDPRERDPRDRDPRDRDPRDRDPRERDHRDIRDRDLRDRDMRDVRDRDHRDIRDRDTRDRDIRDRDDRRDPRDFRDSRGRFDRDDRRGGFDRNEPFRRNDRDFRDGRDRRYGGRFRRHEEEEPEWFSGGPTSQTDTIELRGFDDPERKRRERRGEEEYMEEEKDQVEHRMHKKEKREPPEAVQVPEQHPQNALPVQSFTDLMQGQQSQGIQSESPALPYNPDFDFNQIFNIENIPGLSDLPLFGNTEEPENQSLGVSGSKFSRWFQGDTGATAAGLFGNQQDSRRSSINEGEFGYLNDLVGGQKTPSGGPSPPPNMMGQRMQSNLFSQFPRFESHDPNAKQQQTNILELLHNAKMNARGQEGPMMMGHASDSRPTAGVGGLMASDLERDLKAMILPGAGSNQRHRTNGGNTPPPPMPKLGLGMPGKITTVAELEANLKEMDMSNNNRQQRTTPGGVGPGGNMGMPQANRAAQGTMPGGLLPNVLPGHNAQQAPRRPSTGAQGAPQQPSPTDMTAFNKLLGMMKQAGTLGQAQMEMQKVAGEARMSPRQQQMAPPTGHMPGQQKDILQMLTQQNIQHQIQHQLQQQQVKLKHQQQQQQQQMQEQILKFVKQNPAIITPKPPASPCPPALAGVATLQPPALGSHLQPPASPRCPSPGMPGLLQQPSSSTPNAPSPIMFGSQPPMHLTAPSPIHASQIQPPASPNTLQVTGQANKQIARVPSPQELVAHTQAIMQNALIKKQLEDQKERFMRKQHDPVVKSMKSPNAPVVPGAALQFQFPPVSVMSKGAPMGGMSQINTGSVNTPTVQQPKVLPAFTPTSVIRKMANEKAEAKENGRDEDGGRNTPTGVRPGVPQVILQADTPPHPGTPGSVSSDGGVTINVPSSLQHQLQQTQDPQQQQALINAHMLQQQPQPCMPGQPQPAGADKRRPLFGQGTMQHYAMPSSAPNQAFTGGRPIVKGIVSPPNGTPPVATVQPQTHQPQPGRPLQAGAGAQGVPNMSVAHTTAASQQQRAIIGSQAGGHGGTSTTAATGTTDITKLLEQQRLQQQRISPTSPNMQRQANPAVLNAQLAAAAAARLPGVQAGIVRPGIPAVNTAVANAAAANAILLQRMMQNPVRPGLGQQAVNINQLNQLAALQAQAAQPRPAAATIDPRLQVTRPGVYPNQLMAPNQPGMPNNTLSAAALNAAISRALSPQPQMAAPIASLGNMKPDGNNLSKWFGNDLFKQQLPNMPPLPVQGQKVLTVDEIERRSQTVTN